MDMSKEVRQMRKELDELKKRQNMIIYKDSPEFLELQRRIDSNSNKLSLLEKQLDRLSDKVDDVSKATNRVEATTNCNNVLLGKITYKLDIVDKDTFKNTNSRKLGQFLTRALITATIGAVVGMGVTSCNYRSAMDYAKKSAIKAPTIIENTIDNNNNNIDN